MRALAYCGAVRKIRPTFVRGSEENRMNTPTADVAEPETVVPNVRAAASGSEDGRTVCGRHRADPDRKRSIGSFPGIRRTGFDV